MPVTVRLRADAWLEGRSSYEYVSTADASLRLQRTVVGDAKASPVAAWPPLGGLDLKRQLSNVVYRRMMHDLRLRLDENRS